LPRFEDKFERKLSQASPPIPGLWSPAPHQAFTATSKAIGGILVSADRVT
jgi:hypothetical protein